MSAIGFDLSEAKDTGFLICSTSKDQNTTLCKHIVKQILNAGLTAYVLDVSQAWTMNSPINHMVKASSEAIRDMDETANTSSVLDLSQLNYEQRGDYVIAFTKAIYDWHKSKGHKKAPFEFVIYEQAHTYLLNGCFKNINKYAPLIDLMSIGANFNLRYGVIAQSPLMIERNIVKECQQRYFGCTTDADDLHYIKSFVGKKYADIKKGQFLYQLRNRTEKIESPL